MPMASSLASCSGYAHIYIGFGTDHSHRTSSSHVKNNKKCDI